MSSPLTRKSRIVGPNGKPFSLMLYPSPRTSSRSFKPRPWLSSDTKQNVSEYDRAELVNYSRQLRAQIDVLATAIEQKNNWAFGDAWEPHYTGDNLKWSEEAQEFLTQQFYPMCNVRGPQFDMRTSMKLMGQAWDVDGDDLMVLTETENHFPQIAFFPSTRIGTGRGVFGRKTEEAGNGLKIFDGIIFNPKTNRMIYARLLNEDGSHTDISAYNCDLGFEPQWCDQMRGIPRIATSLLQWFHLQDIDGRLLDALKRAVGISFKVKNAEGEAPIMNEIITAENSPTAEAGGSEIVGGSPETRKIHYEEIAGGGEVWYLDSTQNEDLEPLNYANPHPNVEALIERVKRGALNSVGWNLELLNLAETGRAPSRLLCDLANQTIWDRQATGLRRWKRIIGYALAKAAKHGYLRKPSDPMDYARWEPGLPKHLSVDAGNDAKIAIEAIKVGLSTKGIEAAKAGYHANFIRQKRKEELRDLIADATELHALVESKGITFQTCMEWVEQRSPNPVSQPAPVKGNGKDEEE